MEIVGFARGHLAGLQEWINLLGTTYWPHKAKQADGKIVNAFSRTGISPIVPMSIIFPEKSLPFVLGMIKPEGKNEDHIFGASWKANLIKKQIVSSLGLEDLPDSWEEFKHPITDFMKLQKVSFHAFGIKRDRIDENGVEFL